MRPKALSSIIILCLIILLQSCKDGVKKALLLSGENKTEIETTLNHCHQDSNPLKSEAADFLIENMPYHYSFTGAEMESMDSLYLETVHEADNQRYRFYKRGFEKVPHIEESKKPDIETITSQYLVSMIDYACNVWSKSEWSKVYDKSIFFNYVLPYRIDHEAFSDWHQAIDKEFPLLKDSALLSRRGLQYESEEASISSCKIANADGASMKKAVILTNKKSSLSFNIPSKRKDRKRLIVRYTATNKTIHCLLKVNDVILDTLRFYPTRNLDTFGEKWFNFFIPLKKGQNTISLYSANDTLGIDYIQLGAIEHFSPKMLTNLSSHYGILINKESQLCLNFDTTNNYIELQPFDKNNKDHLISFNYHGYPLWEICSHEQAGKARCLEMKFGLERTLSPDSIITMGTYENKPFQQWIFFPSGKDCYRIMNKHTGMFLDYKDDGKTGKKILVQNPYSIKDTQLWTLRQKEQKANEDLFYQIGSSISEALRVFDITHQFQFFTYPGSYVCKGSSLIKAKAGKCVDEANYTVYLCRHLGIPATVDFTPHWGNRSNGHSWSVLIKPDGKGTPFYMGNVPGDTIHYFHPYKKPKVFRTRYQLNKDIYNDMKEEAYVPQLFRNATFTDVTKEYFPTTDIIRKIPKEYKSHRIAYICVFDNREWVPTYYGKNKHGKVTFNSMGRGIMYVMGVPESGIVKPIGNPFYVDDDGTVRDVANKPNKAQRMLLHRKYPFMGEQDYFNSRMSGGKFQGSKRADFLNCALLHEHHGITNGNWYDIPVTNTGQYKYLRYIGPKGSFCNINELEFYDENGRKISGKIIGTNGESWGLKEKVFDGNILTGFGAISPDGNWVGLELNKPSKVSRIRYIGRNDGNCIEAGDEYVLYCWKNGEWEELGTQIASSNTLVWHNVPSDGLFVLSDITKGSEERIFTYKKGKQIWW